jgi:hypothetical protein
MVPKPAVLTKVDGLGSCSRHALLRRLSAAIGGEADISLASSGNVTGVTMLGAEVGPKRLEPLHELVPAATTMA